MSFAGRDNHYGQRLQVEADIAHTHTRTHTGSMASTILYSSSSTSGAATQAKFERREEERGMVPYFVRSVTT